MDHLICSSAARGLRDREPRALFAATKNLSIHNKLRARRRGTDRTLRTTTTVKRTRSSPGAHTHAAGKGSRAAPERRQKIASSARRVCVCLRSGGSVTAAAWLQRRGGVCGLSLTSPGKYSHTLEVLFQTRSNGDERSRGGHTPSSLIIQTLGDSSSSSKGGRRGEFTRVSPPVIIQGVRARKKA